MERRGAFIEAGNYEGNFYGTPKPPKMATGTLQTMTRPDKPKRPKSVNLMDPTFVPEHRYQEENANYVGPLPPDWDVGYTEENEKYYIK